MKHILYRLTINCLMMYSLQISAASASAPTPIDADPKANTPQLIHNALRLAGSVHQTIRLLQQQQPKSLPKVQISEPAPTISASEAKQPTPKVPAVAASASPSGQPPVAVRAIVRQQGSILKEDAKRVPAEQAKSEPKKSSASEPTQKQSDPTEEQLNQARQRIIKTTFPAINSKLIPLLSTMQASEELDTENETQTHKELSDKDQIIIIATIKEILNLLQKTEKVVAIDKSAYLVPKNTKFLQLKNYLKASTIEQKDQLNDILTKLKTCFEFINNKFTSSTYVTNEDDIRFIILSFPGKIIRKTLLEWQMFIDNAGYEYSGDFKFSHKTWREYFSGKANQAVDSVLRFMFKNAQLTSGIKKAVDRKLHQAEYDIAELLQAEKKALQEVAKNSEPDVSNNDTQQPAKTPTTTQEKKISFLTPKELTPAS